MNRFTSHIKRLEKMAAMLPRHSARSFDEVINDDGLSGKAQERELMQAYLALIRQSGPRIKMNQGGSPVSESDALSAYMEMISPQDANDERRDTYRSHLLSGLEPS